MGKWSWNILPNIKSNRIYEWFTSPFGRPLYHLRINEGYCFNDLDTVLTLLFSLSFVIQFCLLLLLVKWKIWTGNISLIYFKDLKCFEVNIQIIRSKIVEDLYNRRVVRIKGKVQHVLLQLLLPVYSSLHFFFSFKLFENIVNKSIYWVLRRF